MSSRKFVKMETEKGNEIFIRSRDVSGVEYVSDGVVKLYVDGSEILISGSLEETMRMLGHWTD